ncbi:hypothetical protein [Flavivirga rizhaonensis]|nr:hypothetical protein [Flavivirga rizhaonensis]
MSGAVTTYILVAPEGFSLDYKLSYSVGIIVSIAHSVWFYLWKPRH